MRHAALALVLIACSMGGCGGGAASSDVIAELDSLARAPSRAVALSTALVTQGTIQVNGTDGEVLTSISQRLQAETSGCAMRTVDATKIAVVFGTTGCPLQSGVVKVSGNATITPSRSGATLVIVMHLTGAIDEEAFDGELTLSTTDGNAYSLTTLGTLGGHDFTIRGITSTAQASAATVTAQGTSAAPGSDLGAVPRTLVYNSLAQRFANCHAYEGSIELKSTADGYDRTLTYADHTPQDDLATLTQGASVSTVKLPHIAACPPAAM